MAVKRISIMVTMLVGLLSLATCGLVRSQARPETPIPGAQVSREEAQTYYVAPNGRDDGPGTLADPRRTIQKAADTLLPGDVALVRGGVYTETVTVNVSGSAGGGYVTFRSYPGETAVLDASDLSVPDADTGLFLIVDQSYVVIEGFEIRNYQTSAPNRVPVGIHVRGAAHHIQLKNNHIHHIETHAPAGDADAHGIAIYGTDAPQALHDVLIEGNELHDLTLGSSEALALNGNVTTFTVTHNIVHDADNIGLDFIGFEGTAPDPAYDQARNGLVSENVVYNIDTLGNPSYGGERSAGGIYVDGGANIVIERNQLFAANIGLEIASEHAGRATSAITVRSNFIYHNHIAGIAMGGYDTQRGSTIGCTIVNNTLFYNDSDQQGNGELLIQFDVRDNVIKNNLFYANEQSLLISNPYTQNSNNVVDYNLYFALAGSAPSEWQWRDVSYQGFGAYRSGTGNDPHGLFANPLLVDEAAPDLHLDAASPAVNVGENLPAAGDWDIDGEARIGNGRIDLGADEYTPPGDYTFFAFLPVTASQ